MAARHESLKSNFPPSKSGMYTWQQADEFAWTLVIQWLAHVHRPFLEHVTTQTPNLHDHGENRWKVSETILCVNIDPLNCPLLKKDGK